MSRWEHLDAVVRRWALWANDDRRAAYEHVLGAIRDLKGRGRPTHAAAVSGCTGTGEDFAYEFWRHFPETRERPAHWGRFNPWYEGSQLEEPEGCTATTAVLEGVSR